MLFDRAVALRDREVELRDDALEYYGGDGSGDELSFAFHVLVRALSGLILLDGRCQASVPSRLKILLLPPLSLRRP